MADAAVESSPKRINVDAPLWDLNTFEGRLRYFFWMTDWRVIRHPEPKFHEAKELLELYRQRREPPGTTDDQVRYAMKLYKSAFHPDSGELQNVVGRMSFQVPGGMAITALMLQFYKTNTAVIFWQWVNQSFNALVNYTNRNAASEITPKQMAVAYCTAVSSALVTAVGLKSYLATRAAPLFQRFVPFAAVASANAVNIPLTRQSELIDGIQCYDEHGNEVTKSRYAAVKGISQVVFSRITMAAPGMLIMPVIMESLEKKPWFARMRWFHLPFQTVMLGLSLTVMVPVGCALFPQRSSITIDKLQRMDKEKYEELKERFGENIPTVLYFNKGL